MKVDDEEDDRRVAKKLSTMTVDAPSYDTVVLGTDGVGYIWTFQGS